MIVTLSSLCEVFLLNLLLFKLNICLLTYAFYELLMRFVVMKICGKMSALITHSQFFI